MPVSLRPSGSKARGPRCHDHGMPPHAKGCVPLVTEPKQLSHPGLDSLPGPVPRRTGPDVPRRSLKDGPGRERANSGREMAKGDGWCHVVSPAAPGAWRRRIWTLRMARPKRDVFNEIRTQYYYGRSCLRWTRRAGLGNIWRLHPKSCESMRPRRLSAALDTRRHWSSLRTEHGRGGDHRLLVAVWPDAGMLKAVPHDGGYQGSHGKEAW
jgi:hypothetical protein